MRQIIIGLLVMVIVIGLAVTNVRFGKQELAQVGQTGVSTLTNTSTANLASRSNS
ncbi:hypothetical protein C7445_1533 [Alicyclobacillus sacchari]|uniref:Uncharacterized protein n=1 Tax=Alicyclobacillus sacchari TaxID=392010 RepID=A0A4R8L4T0_9BACL|nr:hypothetical protein [Alicyclobacillus sacchari]TDY37295.1 hypothetical protein C7445_1533 [Alicyclobacillus sacchari]GMA59501.1 hypothetical protein GCM10025858_40050 [Alicyclobacillus sacchari]